jgi:predicted DNA-binding ribbon-helix-helix protein
MGGGEPMSIEVFDTDADDMPHAVTVRGEVCTIRHERGNFSSELRLTVDEAQVLREKLTNWLFHSEDES